jgi:hypothetical protein
MEIFNKIKVSIGFKKIFLFLNFVLIIGCNQVIVFKDFAYTDIEKQYKHIKLNARLIGKDKELNNNLMVRGKPYRLIISFISLNSSLNDKVIVINNIKLFCSNRQKIILYKKDIKISFKFRTANNHLSAVYFIENIGLEYENILLFIDFSLYNEKKFSHKLQEYFIKNYKEEKITFWDKLMGI